MKLLCIDGNSILNRAFYGIKQLSTKSGLPTNAIFGFFNILLKMKQELSPDAIVVAFDLSAPTFRHKQYDLYKANRKGMPDELAVQLPITKDLIKLMGYMVVEKEGFEADDILGAFSKRCLDEDVQCVLATGDRDSLQLVNEKITVRLATTKEAIIYDPKKIMETYGVTPRQLIEVKALMGDSSDNIPGVKGIGEKTALGLIQQFGSLDNVYENIESEDIKPRIKNLLLQEKETAYLSRELATITFDVPIDLNIENYLIKPPQQPELVEKITELEMVSLISKLGLSEAAAIAPPKNEQEKLCCDIALNPNTDEVKSQLEKAGSFDFIIDVDAGELKTLTICLNRSAYLYNYNPHMAFEQLIGGNNLPKRTAGVKKVYRYAIDNGVTVQNIVLDTELAAYLLNASAKSYSIPVLCEEYLQDTQTDCEQKDVALFSPLCDALEADLNKKNLSKLLTEIEIPFAEVLAEMELTGFRIDLSGVTEFGNMLEQKIEILNAEIMELAGEIFNPNSPQQLGEILFNKLSLPAKKKTKSGYSTNSEVLEYLADKHPIVPKVLEYRKLTKLNSTYVVGLKKVVGADGRVHSIFKQTEARTGRISSTEPNMQNIPIRTELGKEMRKFFVAKDGYVLIDADYSQIELRILAHIANDKNMIDAFLHNADIHSITASQVFGVPLEEVPPVLRSRSKAINFGIVYGIGAFSLSQDIGVTVSEAASYIDNYLKTYSGVKKYMTDTVEFGKKHGYVLTLFDRRRDLPELSSSNHNLKAFGERVAMNTPIQGSAADILKIAMIKVRKRLHDENLDAKIVLQVHDEIILEASEKDSEHAAQVLKQEMEHAAQLHVPLKADVSSGKTWYAAKE